MKSRMPRLLLIGSLAINALLLALVWDGLSVPATRADVGPTQELVPYMEIMQHLSHKLGLAIQAKNEPLASFYLEEIEETTNVIRKKFPTYDRMDIAELAGAMLVPSIGPLEKSLSTANWDIANAAYAKLIDSCNDCHAATEHEYVKIIVPTANPFNQTLSPQ